MSRAIEVIVEPNGVIRPLQPIQVKSPTRAFLTLTETIETDSAAVEDSERGTGRALLRWLEEHRLSPEARLSAEEIDAYIRELRGDLEYSGGSGDGREILALLQSPRFITRPPADPQEIEERIQAMRDDWGDE
jgi:predicted DNA-binding antitoxin AbrB/MazE fold protein